jgi:hypothetical protein
MSPEGVGVEPAVTEALAAKRLDDRFQPSLYKIRPELAPTA